MWFGIYLLLTWERDRIMNEPFNGVQLTDDFLGKVLSLVVHQSRTEARLVPAFRGSQSYHSLVRDCKDAKPRKCFMMISGMPGRLDERIPEGMCFRCGLTGPHENSVACIDTLRDRIAVLEFRLGNVQTAVTRERAAANGRTLGRRASLKPVAEIPRFVAG